MKIPTYISEQQAASPTLRTAPPIEPINLSSAINALENQIGIAQDRKDKEWNSYVNSEYQRTQLEIDKKYFELEDSIANGGDYANAEKEFQNFFSKATKKSMTNLSRDPLLQREIGLKYDRYGLEYGIKIKSKAQQRMRDDTISTFTTREEMYKNRYATAGNKDEKHRILDTIRDDYAQLEASGVLHKDAGRLGYMKFLSDAKGADLQILTQTQGANAGLDFLDKNKDYFSGENYIKSRLDLENLAVEENQNSMVRSFLNNEDIEEPTQEAVDTFSATQETINQDPVNYESEMINLISKSGKVPSNISATLSGLMDVLPERINQESAGKIASAARIISRSTEENPALLSASIGFDKDTQTASMMISEQLNRGVDELTAVKTTLTKLNDPVFSEVYSKSRTEFVGSKKYPGLVKDLKKEFGVSDLGLSYLRSDAIDIYAYSKALGANDKAATKAVIQQLKGKVSKFNNIEVLQPPHLVTNFTNEKVWIEAAQNKINEIYPDLAGQLKPVLSSDNLTMRKRREGVKSSELPFALSWTDTDGNPVPVRNKNGRQMYVTATPEMQKTQLKKTTLFGQKMGVLKTQRDDLGSLDLPDKKDVGSSLMLDLQKELGLNKISASGIVGNLAHESGGFKTLQEITPLVKGSRGGYGYAQWTGERRLAFEKWSEDRNLDTSSYEANKGFLLHELKNTSEGNVLNKLKAARTPEEAAKIFSDHFLRPAIPHDDKRASLADKYYKG